MVIISSLWLFFFPNRRYISYKSSGARSLFGCSMCVYAYTSCIMTRQRPHKRHQLHVWQHYVLRPVLKKFVVCQSITEGVPMVCGHCGIADFWSVIRNMWFEGQYHKTRCCRTVATDTNDVRLSCVCNLRRKDRRRLSKGSGPSFIWMVDWASAKDGYWDFISCCLCITLGVLCRIGSESNNYVVWQRSGCGWCYGVCRATGNVWYYILRRSATVVEDLGGGTKVLESLFGFNILETDELHNSSVYLYLRSCAYIYEFDPGNMIRGDSRRIIVATALQRNIYCCIMLYTTCGWFSKRRITLMKKLC